MNSLNTQEIIKISDYTYELPEDRIAKYPLSNRDESKLLVYQNGSISETQFSDLASYIPSSGTIIFNDTKVIHARLEFQKDTGASIEIFCLAPHNPVDYQLAFAQTQTCIWKCMVGNLKKWKSGKLVLNTVISGVQYRLEAKQAGLKDGDILIQFSWNRDISFGKLIDYIGKIPIPPYLKRSSEEIDNTRYQTIYSKPEGSVAAPTAGLHYTEAVFRSLGEKGISLNTVTLHVGAGTFQPVKSGNAFDHPMHQEYFSASRKLIESLSDKKGPLISTGTTTLRTLESIYWLGLKSIATGKVQTDLDQWEYTELEDKTPAPEVFFQFAGLLKKQGIEKLYAKTRIMIVPGYQFKVVDALITNYHQPGSTLLLLVAAFIGEDWRKVYNYSMKNNFRFLSYGDSSLLWR